jgi:hypothetical protein
MQYVHILSLIDTYLDRLKEARQVLLALDDSPSRARRLVGPPPIRMKKLKTPGSERQGLLGLEITPPKRKRTTESTKIKAAATKRVAVRSTTPPRISEPVFVQDELFPEAQAPQPAQHAGQEKNEKRLDLVVAEPVVTIIAPAQRSRTRTKTAKAPVERALGGSVSAAPVFIPAAQIRQERSEKTQADSVASSTAAPLTAELLTQRWVQGLNF